LTGHPSKPGRSTATTRSSRLDAPRVHPPGIARDYRGFQVAAAAQRHNGCTRRRSVNEPGAIMLSIESSRPSIADTGAPTFETVDLDFVVGGVIPWQKLGRYVPGVGSVIGVADAINGYNDWRTKGHGVVESVAKGAVEWAKSATYYDVWGSTPAY
jgi:hypothetical protein